MEGTAGIPRTNEALLRDAPRRRWLRFEAPRAVIAARRVSDVLPALKAVERAVDRRGLWAAGFIAYEAAPAFDAALAVRDDGAFPLLYFGLYDEPRACRLPEPLPWHKPPAWRPSVNARDYARAIRRIREYIRAGDTYQVNYTLRLRARGVRDPWGLFLGLVAAQNPSYGAWLSTEDWALCCASPELFFRLDGDRIESRPMKGTAARGLWPAQDSEQAAALGRSEKDRAENVMIVDMVRNDLGRIARPGSVHVTRRYAVERLPTAWQMTSTVKALTRAPLADILAATFPPASITGAPKPRTMEIITQLETAPRRVYTGTIGFIAPGRRAQFNVAIRTALVERSTGEAEYGVGGGIVWDSDADLERIECRTKALVLNARPAPFELLETMRWTPRGGYGLQEEHLARMARSARYFGYALRPAAVRKKLREVALRLPRTPHRVRLLVDRRGRCRCEAAEAGVSMAARALHLPLRRTGGAGPASRGWGCSGEERHAARVALARTPVNSRDVFLYHKTTNRAMYEKARAERPGYDDVILFNERGQVTESTIANIVVEISGALCTPPVECGLLQGTYREAMLRRGAVRERVIEVAELLRARRVWLMNSVRGMYAVRVDRDTARARGET